MSIDKTTRKSNLLMWLLDRQLYRLASIHETSVFIFSIRDRLWFDFLKIDRHRHDFKICTISYLVVYIWVQFRYLKQNKHACVFPDSANNGERILASYFKVEVVRIASSLLFLYAESTSIYWRSQHVSDTGLNVLVSFNPRLWVNSGRKVGFSASLCTDGTLRAVNNRLITIRTNITGLEGQADWEQVGDTWKTHLNRNQRKKPWNLY